MLNNECSSLLIRKKEFNDKYITYHISLPFDPEEDLAIQTTGFLLLFCRTLDRSNRSFLSSGFDTFRGRALAEAGGADSILLAMS